MSRQIAALISKGHLALARVFGFDFCQSGRIGATSSSARPFDLPAALALRGLLTLNAACPEALFPAPATLKPSRGNPCHLKPSRWRSWCPVPAFF